MDCDTCKMKRVCDELERMGKVPKHEKCRCYTPTKPITNYEKLIRKTPEELAAWIVDHPVVSEYDENNPKHKAWLDWLKQEAQCTSG